MSSALSTIHLLAGALAEINEAEANLHRASETLAGVKAQMLHAISEASRPVDPAPQVDEGAAAPGKPPRPTEGGVAVSEDGSPPVPSEAGGDGSADLGAGACALTGGAAISPEADQALDGASLGEGTPLPADPRFAPGGVFYERVLIEYGVSNESIRNIARDERLPSKAVRAILKSARAQGDRRVMRGDAYRSTLGTPIE